jgi:fumarate hydratase subunit beta
MKNKYRMYIIYVDKHLNILSNLETFFKNQNKIKIMKNLTTPISDEDISGLSVGDKITISGTIYTGRDAALPQLVRLAEKGDVPFDLEGSVIMHTAFSDAGIAPTTSSKVEIESSIEPLSRTGVKIHIGKGTLGGKTAEALAGNNSVFVITPPVAALLTSKVIEKECVLFEWEGMEAIFRLEVDRIPGIVAIAHGERI